MREGVLQTRTWRDDWFSAQHWPLYGVLAALFLFLNLYAPADPTLTQRLLAMLLVLLCLWPAALWLGGRESGRPLLPFFGALYAAFFASPVFLRDGFYGRWTGQPPFDEAQITQALLLALVGWLCFLPGFFVWRLRPLSRLLPQVRLAWSDHPRVIKALAVAIGAAALPALIVDTTVITMGFYTEGVVYPDWFRFLIRTTGQLAMLSIALLCLLQWRGELGLAGKVFLWGALVVPYSWLGVGTGVILRGVEPILAVILAYSVQVSARPWRAILGATAMFLMFVLVLLPTRLDYRELAWTDEPVVEKEEEEVKPDTGEEGGKLVQKTVKDLTGLNLRGAFVSGVRNGWLYARTVVQRLRGGDDRYARWLDAAAFRLDQLTPLAHVMAHTPEKTPYRNGATYLRLSIIKVPLALAAGVGLEGPPLPSETAIARESYGISADARRWNPLEGYNFHPISEWFMNFGMLAIPLGMFLLGAVHGGIQRLFVYPGAGVVTLAAGVPILTVTLVRAGAFVSASWGSAFVLAYAVFLGLVTAGILRWLASAARD